MRTTHDRVSGANIGDIGLYNSTVIRKNSTVPLKREKDLNK